MYFLGIYADGFVVLSQGRQRPLRTLPILLLLCILHELLRVLIDAEIREMYEPFSHIFGLDIVLISGKSSKSLFEHINSQGVITSN